MRTLIWIGPPAQNAAFGAEGRVNALTLAVTNQDKVVLDALTDYDGKYIGTVGNVGNVDLMQYMRNASGLGALFKLTLLDPNAAGLSARDKKK